MTGDQATGDRLATAIGGRAAEPDARDGVTSLRSAIRRWRALHLDAVPGRPFSPRAIAKALPPLADVGRQVGILTDVLGLSPAQSAEALDRSEGEITVLLAQSRSRQSAPLGRSVLIVEDDPIIAAHLAQIATGIGATAVRLAGNAEDALRSADAEPPDLALCDIDLGDGADGVSVVRHLTAEHDSVCVFVTAHPAAATSGTDGEPAFVVPKPFSEDAIRAALRYAATADRPAVLAA